MARNRFNDDQDDDQDFRSKSKDRDLSRRQARQGKAHQPTISGPRPVTLDAWSDRRNDQGRSRRVG